jgi:hypothetical protein
MSIYNMVMPKNPALDILVAAAFAVTHIHDEIIVNIPADGLGRVRDAWLPEGENKVCILHRNYGEADVYTKEVAKSASYVGYHKWEGDCTYAWWEFDIPAMGQLHVALKIMLDEYPWLSRHPMERYIEIVEGMGDPAKADDPDVMRAERAGEQLIAGVADAMESGEPRAVNTPQGSAIVVAFNPEDKVKGN